MRTVLKSKIHRATVTDANLHYEGSVTIDRDLMEAADILPYEQVQLLDVENGARLTTYAIEGERGSGEIVVNGAAAHLVHEGHLAIILTYTDLPEERARSHHPRLVYVDEQNRIVRTERAVEGAPAQATGASSNGSAKPKPSRVTATELRAMKRRGERIAMLTAYDFPSARLVDDAGADVILVGDTLGMVVLGYDTTVPVTMDEMLHHVKAVTRGTKRALLVADMPFMSYQTNADDALRNAARFMKEADAQAIKLEGGVTVADTVRKIVDAGIPVMGHIGLTPQSVHQFGGWKVQGKTPQAAIKLMNDALALERAGAFAVVLELVPAPLAELISQRLRIPTIGIGAGAGCDGQVQVYHDVLGLFEGFVPKHAKQYAQIGEATRNALAQYVSDVREGNFPTDEQSFSMNEQALAELRTSDDPPLEKRSLHPSIPVLS